MALPTANRLPWPNETEFKATMADYERSLGHLDSSQLSNLLTTINGQIAAQPPIMDQLLAKLAHESQPLGRSTNPAIQPDPSTRGQNAQASPASRPPSPLDLLARSMRMGPRLAGKLILASARSNREG